MALRYFVCFVGTLLFAGCGPAIDFRIPAGTTCKTSVSAGPNAADVTSALQREVTSVANLDTGLGISTLATMVPALQAELCTVQLRWSEAIVLFDGFLGSLDADGQGRLSAKFLAQRAWCMANLGQQNAAEESAKGALTSIEDCPDLDDLAVVYDRLAATFAALGKGAEASAHTAIADRCLSAYRDSQRQLQSAIREVLVPIQGHEEENPATGRV